MNNNNNQLSIENGSAALLAKKLILSVKDGDFELVKELIDAGADLNFKDNKNNNITPLIVASSLGHADIVRLLIESGADIFLKSDWGQENALLYACNAGHKDIVKILLDAGLDANTCSQWRYTALEYAAGRGHEEITQLLLDAGADVNFVENDELDSCLIMAAQEGYPKIVKILIDAGADVNHLGDFEHNALMRALSLGYRCRQNKILSVVSLLIEAGIDVCVGTARYSAFTCLIEGYELYISRDDTEDFKDHNAVEDDQELIQLLLDSGAKIGRRDLEYAKRVHYRALIKILIANGIDVAT